MGEKVKENFCQIFSEKILGPQCRAAGPSRHAESVNVQRAELEVSQFLSLRMSHALRAPAVRSTEILTAAFRRSTAEISLYWQVALGRSAFFPERCFYGEATLGKISVW